LIFDVAYPQAMARLIRQRRAHHCVAENPIHIQPLVVDRGYSIGATRRVFGQRAIAYFCGAGRAIAQLASQTSWAKGSAAAKSLVVRIRDKLCSAGDDIRGKGLALSFLPAAGGRVET
jgi:hypothetical protein